MKKILTVILLGIATLSTAVADDFKILFITTPEIMIDGKSRQKGDIITGKSKIKWTSPRQAIKVMNTRTKQQSLVVAEKYNAVKSGDLASFLASSKQMSTRKGALINVMELGMVLNDTHYLLDSLRVESRLPVDNDHFFFATYEYGDEKINKKLHTDPDGALIFDRSLFTIDGKPIEPFDVTLSIFYMDKSAGRRTLVTDSMLLLPL